MGNTTAAPTTEVCVRRKVKDGWYVYTCDQLPGLYVAHQDDRVAYNDLPASIAMLIKLNNGIDCSVAHKMPYHDFIRGYGINKARDAVEERTQDLIDSDADRYFQFILQQVEHMNG